MADLWIWTATVVGLAAILGGVLIGICAILAAILRPEKDMDEHRDS